MNELLRSAANLADALTNLVIAMTEAVEAMNEENRK